MAKLVQRKWTKKKTQHCSDTLEEMCVRLHEDFPYRPRVCCQTISRALDGRLLSLRFENDPRIRTLPRQSGWITGNWMMGRAIQQPYLIFLAKFKFNVWTARIKGGSPVGTRAVRIICNQRGYNLILCLALSPN